MRRFLSVVVFGLFFSTIPSFASTSPCETNLLKDRFATLSALRERSQARVNGNYTRVAAPGFDNIEDEVKKEQLGERGPEALQDQLPADFSFVATPAPHASDIAAVSLVKQDLSLPLHVDLDWHGQRTSTAVYASLPKSTARQSNEYLIGPEYPVAVVFLHGGGTPTASGKNAMSVGEHLAKFGIPVLGPDMPGHGRGTRQLRGLDTFQGMADWLMALIDKTVSPKTKIILAGHSWGGEFAVFMHRLSNDPKYARIAEYIALSPPVDVSLGGEIADKVKFEEWFSENFTQFKDQSAPSDYEFHENLLANGKESDIGGLFATLSDFDFRTPRLSVEEQARLKPLTVYVGDKDLLVYVGREKQFQEAFGSLVAPSRYIVAGDGITWKSKDAKDLQPTGHNIFDRLEDGTQNYEVYKLLADAALKYAPEPASGPAADAAEQVYDRFIREWAGFFAFREMVEDRVEYVDVSTADLPALTSQKIELDRYLSKVSELKNETNRMVNSQIEADVQAFRIGLGLNENIRIKRAREELAMPALSNEHRQEIKVYLTKVGEAEQKIQAEFQDPAFEADVARLSEQFRDSLPKIGATRLEQYRSALDGLAARRDLNNDEKKLRADLTKLHQAYSEILKAKQGRFNRARDRAVDAIPRPPGISNAAEARMAVSSDRSAEDRQRLQRFVTGYDQIEADARRKALASIDERIAHLPRPSGVTSVESALARKAEADSVLVSTSVPAGAPEIAPLAARVKTLQAEWDEVNSGNGQRSLAQQIAYVRDLKLKWVVSQKRWNGIWSKGILTSPGVRDWNARFEEKLRTYKDKYFAYSHAKNEWLIGLKTSGQEMAAAVLKMPAELKVMRAEFQKAKREFMAFAVGRDSMRVREALANRLEGPDGAIRNARQMAGDMWGKNYDSTHIAAPASLASQVKAEEHLLEERLRRQATVQHELGEARVAYTQKMISLGFKVPYRVERVPIYAHLNQSKAALLKELREQPLLVEAFQKTLSKWDELAAESRRESDSKDAGLN